MRFFSKINYTNLFSPLQIKDIIPPPPPTPAKTEKWDGVCVLYVPSVYILVPRTDPHLIKQKDTFNRAHAHTHTHTHCGFCHHSYFLRPNSPQRHVEMNAACACVCARSVRIDISAATCGQLQTCIERGRLTSASSFTKMSSREKKQQLFGPMLENMPSGGYQSQVNTLNMLILLKSSILLKPKLTLQPRYQTPMGASFLSNQPLCPPPCHCPKPQRSSNHHGRIFA